MKCGFIAAIIYCSAAFAASAMLPQAVHVASALSAQASKPLGVPGYPAQTLEMAPPLFVDLSRFLMVLIFS